VIAVHCPELRQRIARRRLFFQQSRIGGLPGNRGGVAGFDRCEAVHERAVL